VLPTLKLGHGRNRVRVRAIFQLGSGSGPITLSRVLVVCRAQAARPPFTG